MAPEITAALVSVAVLGLWFTSTRVIALAAVGALTARYPPLGLAILIASAGYFCFRFRNRS